MTTRPKPKRDETPPELPRAHKDYGEVAERVFPDDTPAEPLYGGIVEEPGEDAA